MSPVQALLVAAQATSSLLPPSAVEASAFSPLFLALVALLAGVAMQTVTIAILYARLRAARRESALEASDGSTLRQDLEELPAAVLLVSGHGLVVDANAEAGRIFGCPVEALAGRSLVGGLLPPRDVAGRSARELLEGGEGEGPSGAGADFRVPLPDGTRRSMRWVCRGRQGEGATLCLGVEVEEPDAGYGDPARLRQAVVQTADGVAMADLDGTITFVNPAWLAMHGYQDASDVLGESLALFHSPEQMIEDVVPFNRRVVAEGCHDGEVGHMRRDGSTFSCWMSTSLIRDRDGTPLGYVGIARDVTEIKRSREELARSNARLVSLLESSDDMIMLADRFGRVVLCNTAFTRTFERALGRRILPGMATPDHIQDAESRAALQRMHARALSGERFQAGYAHTFPDAESRLYEMTYNPVFTGDQVQGFSVFIRDVTKQGDAVKSDPENGGQAGQGTGES